MSEERDILAVRVLEKEYRISCLPAERESLLVAARELDARMRETHAVAKVLGIEHIAVITALNLIHEREELKSSREQVLESAQEVIRRLEGKVDAAIGRREAV